MNRQPFSDKTIYDHLSPQSADQVPLKVYQDLERRVVAQGRQLTKARRALEKKAAQLEAAGLQLAEAEHSERRRLAHLLHDHIQQLLVAARMQSDLLLYDQPEGPGHHSAQMIHDLLGEAVEASRLLTTEIHPPILRQQGLCAALQWLIDDVRQKHALNVTAELDTQAEPTDEARQAFIYNAVRELLFNIVKHSGSRQAALKMTGDGENVIIAVRDFGCGFDAPSLSTSGQSGFGLFSIRDRIALLGGQMHIESVAGKGSLFTLIMPRHSIADRLPTRE